jgi:hypothetical protein
MFGAKTIIPVSRFTGVPTGNPTTTTLITQDSDNGYGLQIPFGNIPAGGSSAAVWYLAGAANVDLTSSVFSAISAPLAPSIASFSVNSLLNKTGAFTYTVTFASAVSGLETNDFTLSGTGASSCVIDSLTGSGTTYSLSITGCGEGTIVANLAANSVADALNNLGPANPYSASSVRVDQTAPTVSSAIPVNGAYSATGTSALNVTVTFSESVTVSGTPRIPITIGTTSRFANYISMSDSKTATFRFSVTVDYNDIDLDGIVVNSPLDLNSGTISDLASNAMSTFSFTPPSSTTAYVYQPPSAPTIDSITANNTSLTIYFTAGAANGSTVTNYQYSTNNGGAFSVTITGLTNGTTYQIVIKAISNLGVGLASNMLSSAPTASATVNISLTASATTASKGTPITITAQVNQAGVVTFFWNGKRISGCIKKTATTSATCIWKPSVTGQWSVQALLDPTDPSYVNSYSAKLPVFILKRAGAR